MSRYFNVWVSFGILAPLLLAAGAIVCSEKEKLLQLLPSKVTQQTDCLMECTGMTYIKKLELQDNRNIRLKDSSEGKEPHSDMIFYSRMLQNHITVCFLYYQQESVTAYVSLMHNLHSCMFIYLILYIIIEIIIQFSQFCTF